MLRIALFALFFLIPGFLPRFALAEIPIQECGAPPPANMPTDPGGHYCNIYSRQLAYGDENKKFMDQLKERQKNFAAPSMKASQQYREDVQTRHGFKQKEPADAAAGSAEAYGPPAQP